MSAEVSNTEFIILLLLLFSMVFFAVCTVVVKDLLKSAIALGAASIILSIIMFFMKSYLAAVFELSVCAGLITVVIISTISLIKQRDKEEAVEYAKMRKRRFIYLPFILLITGLSMFALRKYINTDYAAISIGFEPAVQEILWNVRKTDIIGQIIIILAGVFGVTILFREGDNK